MRPRSSGFAVSAQRRKHASASQCEALLNLALEACEHYYPAFQFVLWGGKTAEEAVAAAILECAGQA